LVTGKRAKIQRVFTGVFGLDCHDVNLRNKTSGSPAGPSEDPDVRYQNIRVSFGGLQKTPMYASKTSGSPSEDPDGAAKDPDWAKDKL
jgi:hypothetical protein